MTDINLQWKVHTPTLLKEMLNNNPGMECFRIPLSVFGLLLYQVGERAAQLNDPELNDLMMRLTIYEEADPEIHPRTNIPE